MSRITEDTSVYKLAWPIFIETLLFMMMGNIDTFMLSRFSDLAVAAVGNANQMINTLIILFNITTAATGVMVTQYLGAKQEDSLNQVYTLAALGNVVLALIISGLLFLFQAQIFSLVKIPLVLIADTKSYMDVIIGFLAVAAMYMILSTIHKSHGRTKLTMFVAIMMNALNILGNYIALFGPFGLPVLGVKGVAISTVFARSFGAAILLVVLVRLTSARFGLQYLKPFPVQLAKKFMLLGLPSAMEPISWQFSQMAIFTMINLMGTQAVTARMYAMMLIMFTYLFAISIAQATQILTGHLVGAGKEDLAYHLVIKSVKKAWGISLLISTIMIIFRLPLLGIFTNDSAIIAIGASVLIVDLFLEWGRATNVTLIFSMRAAGDVHFPVIVGIFSMWGIATLGAYILGVHLGYGLVGIWVAMAMDEVFRGVIMIFRWRSGKWRGKSVVKT